MVVNKDLTQRGNPQSLAGQRKLPNGPELIRITCDCIGILEGRSSNHVTGAVTSPGTGRRRLVWRSSSRVRGHWLGANWRSTRPLQRGRSRARRLRTVRRLCCWYDELLGWPDRASKRAWMKEPECRDSALGPRRLSWVPYLLPTQVR
ncbi:Uncharacterized protein HZ326_26481 [Fusarium oxysporum f. sp. albedinis]|nr:Uncharacterized protein HZ326_26481 [Fusarium oxysporum f. sp. albedinis]